MRRLIILFKKIFKISLKRRKICIHQGNSKYLDLLKMMSKNY
jgi:hypothetical protein